MDARRRRGLTAVLISVCLVLLAGCGRGPEPRTVTAKEADKLAAARFLNYQEGGRSVRVVVPNTTGRMTIDASVDFSEHVGYGVLETEGSNAAGSQGLLQWSTKVVAMRAEPRPPLVQPVTPPQDGWTARPLRTHGASLDTALLLAFSLASDRPDDAQLLRQNGARWLRSERVGSTRTDVFEDPNRRGADEHRLRYWLDSAGKMVKVEARLGTAEMPVVYTFDRRRYIPVKPVRGLTR